MVKQKTDQAVMALIIKQDQILMEKRAKDSKFFPNQIIFIGGKIEDDETDNYEKALKRELKEELNIQPTNYIYLDKEIFGDSGVWLRCFIITEWQGQLPKCILDVGNPICWQKIDDMAKSEIRFVREVIAALQEHQKNLVNRL